MKRWFRDLQALSKQVRAEKLERLLSVPEGGSSGSVAWADVSGKPSTFTPSSHSHVAADVTDFASAVRAQVEAALLEGGSITITPGGTGATRTLTIAAAGGVGSSPALSWVI